MQVTSLLSHHEHEHKPGCGCGHDHEHAPVRLTQTLLGIVFVVNAFIVDWVLPGSHTVANASAFIGAIILGIPIIMVAMPVFFAGYYVSAREIFGAWPQS